MKEIIEIHEQVGERDFPGGGDDKLAILFEHLYPEFKAKILAWNKFKLWVEEPDAPPNYYTITDKIDELEKEFTF